MKRSSLTTLALASAAIGLGSFAWAQEPAPPSPELPAPSVDQNAPVSDSDLDTFAEIYVDLQETATKFEAEMSAAETEEEAQEVQGKMQQEGMAKIGERGWTPEKFNEIAQVVNNDPVLAEKALALIEEKS
jgi:hypothetical protein